MFIVGVGKKPVSIVLLQFALVETVHCVWIRRIVIDV